MGSVAIVGVEQSGKTALMISWGWHYQHPDRNGYYLTPDPKGGQKTLDYVCSEMNRMRRGSWPIATSKDDSRKLDWVLGRKGMTLGEMSFNDFGGELYRAAFNDGPSAALSLKERTIWDKIAGKPEHQDTPVEKLQRHVKNCSALVILMNLADVINDPQMTDHRTRQMISIVKSMMDVVRNRPAIGGVALVFTQADSYADIIEKAGSLKNAYQTYLPVLAAHYPNVRLFAVSAVNKTIPSETGYPVPAANFEAEGLEKLTAWVAMWQRNAWIVDANFGLMLVYLIVPFCWPFLLFYVLPGKFRFWKARGWQIRRTGKQ
jgi:hypothetical protein